MHAVVLRVFFKGEIPEDVVDNPEALARVAASNRPDVIGYIEEPYAVTDLTAAPPLGATHSAYSAAEFFGEV